MSHGNPTASATAVSRDAAANSSDEPEVKRESRTVIDVPASEDVGEFPDKNVAEALQRVSGVSISREFGEGECVSLRGNTRQEYIVGCIQMQPGLTAHRELLARIYQAGFSFHEQTVPAPALLPR